MDSSYFSVNPKPRITMNRYGQLAMKHWRKTDPERYSRIPNQEAFFSTLGLEVEERIQDVALDLAGPDRPGETYLEKAGRLNMARLRAEELVLAEMVLISGPPENPSPSPSETSLVTELHAEIDRLLREDQQEA